MLVEAARSAAASDARFNVLRQQPAMVVIPRGDGEEPDDVLPFLKGIIIICSRCQLEQRLWHALDWQGLFGAVMILTCYAIFASSRKRINSQESYMSPADIMPG
jgi:hypothetical protein